MNQKDHAALVEIYESKPWQCRDKLLTYIKTLTITEDIPETRSSQQNAALHKELDQVTETRSSQQNKAMHKWFEQIAVLCRDGGIDAKVLMNSTISVEVNADIIKGMWKVLQEALYGTKSTTELNRAKQIDHIVDHFVRFFGEKHLLVLPPFPHRDPVSLIGNTKIPYPHDYQPPTI